jgi:hypothetical protein
VDALPKSIDGQNHVPKSIDGQNRFDLTKGENELQVGNASGGKSNSGNKPNVAASPKANG